MNNKLKKFDNPKRVFELDLKRSFQRIGLEAHHRVCDYGAGTGIVSIELAKLTEGQIYALDMDAEMIALINEKIERKNITNISARKVNADEISIEKDSVDRFLLVTVLHEIDDVPTFVKEVNRVLKPGGKVMVIDFYRKETPMGPPVDSRMSVYQASRHFFREGIVIDNKYDLSENLYLLVLTKKCG